MSDALAAARQRGYAGGQVCPGCESVVGVADYWCRWCGASLREGSA